MSQELVKQDVLGATEALQLSETSTTAVAARAQAAVQARAVVALQRRRDYDAVRIELLADCARPGFAAVARYKVPRAGKYIEGFSIRFAEAAIRALGNLDITTTVVFDGPDKRIVHVAVVDLESNSSYAADVVIDKTIERRKLSDGQVALGTRQTSTGHMVYLVAADEADLQQKQGALVARQLRNGALKFLPGDILDECAAKVIAVLKDHDAKDPDAARKRLADGFAAVGVMPDALKAYIGTDLAGCSPAQLNELRAIYTGLSTGEATWQEIVQERSKVNAGDATSTPKVDALKAALAARKGKAVEQPVPEHDPATGEVVPPVREPGAEG